MLRRVAWRFLMGRRRRSSHCPPEWRVDSARCSHPVGNRDGRCSAALRFCRLRRLVVWRVRFLWVVPAAVAAASMASPSAAAAAAAAAAATAGLRPVSRWRGALLGMAVGDAVGTALEFSAPGTFPQRDCRLACAPRFPSSSP
ncbi:hypothetical protein I4F81_002615 [Pyropia yezoensis]|uniref:Uncharacterized protein n=1 Tax=Pyropia yezoensis TaxID=2788 RepID=A0ACC3BQZ4_PYRYE|nr:hypothetical protein I4F81_002615 [Neopyropia yezoensis]